MSLPGSHESIEVNLLDQLPCFTSSLDCLLFAFSFASSRGFLTRAARRSPVGRGVRSTQFVQSQLTTRLQIFFSAIISFLFETRSCNVSVTMDANKLLSSIVKHRFFKLNKFTCNKSKQNH